MKDVVGEEQLLGVNVQGGHVFCTCVALLLLCS